jgi:hypothetical protein
VLGKGDEDPPPAPSEEGISSCAPALTLALALILVLDLSTHILYQLLEVLILQPLGTHEGHPYRLIVSNQSLSARSESTPSPPSLLETLNIARS